MIPAVVFALISLVTEGGNFQYKQFYGTPTGSAMVTFNFILPSFVNPSAYHVADPTACGLNEYEAASGNHKRFRQFLILVAFHFLPRILINLPDPSYGFHSCVLITVVD